ncbi:hypothetical protein [Marinobacter halophilus]|uniref:Uncharacterized protein n=1 Tax=Marinobacter halophilus TaxID=1323740 RepID=A0A2T1KBU9_9GAMM|nr:hypothetical protein [Marinobacter halophilus]PSF07596.1 hypothetical protein C7H08_11900 [Marinobacter halophilus]GGC56413.1 hypothetical protein GCM10011362_00900 [Marinobacter halophilus]
MDDWQACLAPQCQAALLQARENVASRGGSVITVEDFLLALLDAAVDVVPFLTRQGVDLDELVRTIQGEQPIVAEVHGDGDLSSQLIYWISGTREAIESPWLDWPQLLRGLVHCAERLQDKAYVAVLELVNHWPIESSSPVAPLLAQDQTLTPVTITDPAWLQLAEDVAVILSANRRALVWMRGARGSGKSAWLTMLLATPGLPWVQMDVRRQAEVMASDQPLLPAGDNARASWPALILDNVSPTELLELLAQRDGVVRELLTGWRGPILLLAEGRASPDDSRLSAQLGRELDVMAIPGISVVQRVSILSAHQPVIEKRWNVQLSPAAMEFAASCRNPCVATPGAMLEWLQRAAARLDLFASRGPLEIMAGAAQQETLRRQSLVAMARDEEWQVAEEAMKALAIEQAAAEVVWHERKHSGTLRRLLVEDVRKELERWVAARPGPVHYVLHCDQQQGDSLGAGSGNLYS